jgi:hypothetical protein
MLVKTRDADCNLSDDARAAAAKDVATGGIE